MIVAWLALFLVPSPSPRVAYAQTSFPSNATTCDQTQTQRVASGATSGTAAVQVIALATGTTVRVCSLTVVGTSGTTPTFSLVTGTGSNCGTGQATLVPTFTTTANVPVVRDGPLVTIAPVSTAVCYLDTGTSPVQFYIIKYAQG
jgi:hypothetical protein